MDPIRLAAVLLGALFILMRAPQLFAPAATLRVYERLLASDPSIRGIGVLAAIVSGGLLVAAGSSEEAARGAFAVYGWVLAAAAVWIIVAPTSYRHLTETILKAVGDPTTLRVLATLAILIGAALIRYGLS